jgi:hypothetical protein
VSEQNYTTTFSVGRTAEEVFAAINNVRAWWSGDIEGDTDRLGAEFRYRYQDLHDSTQKITESTPAKRVVWHVVDGYLAFVDNKGEWKDTDIVFDIAEKDGRTEVRFTHVGLKPQCDCFDACSDGWNRFINGSLRRYITTGEVQPNPFEAQV